MIHAPRFPQGSRVRVTRGRFPMSADLLGRTGMVLDLEDDRPGRYGVVLDGEERVRDFAEDELILVQEAGSREELSDTGPTVGP